MIARTTSTLPLVLLVSLLAACSGSPDLASPSTSATTTAPAPSFPEQIDAEPGDPVLILWIAVEPPSAPDDAFALTIQQLADVGYHVAPMDMTCQEGALQALGLADAPGSRGLGLVLSGREAADEFSMAWNGSIVGWTEGALVCDQPG